MLRMLVSSSRSVLASSMALWMSLVAFCSLFELFEREALSSTSSRPSSVVCVLASASLRTERSVLLTVSSSWWDAVSVLVVVSISSVPLSMEDEVIEVSWLSDSVSAGISVSCWLTRPSVVLASSVSFLPSAVKSCPRPL